MYGLILLLTPDCHVIPGGRTLALWLYHLTAYPRGLGSSLLLVGVKPSSLWVLLPIQCCMSLSGQPAPGILAGVGWASVFHTSRKSFHTSQLPPITSASQESSRITPKPERTSTLHPLYGSSDHHCVSGGIPQGWAVGPSSLVATGWHLCTHLLLSAPLADFLFTPETSQRGTPLISVLCIPGQGLRKSTTVVGATGPS